MPDIWTINSIQTASRAAGSHWWDPSTLRFFGTRVLPAVYQGPGGVYFVTTEQPPHGARMASVRQWKPDTSDIDTAGDFCAMSTAKAKQEAKRLASSYLAGPVEVTTEQYEPVTDADQLLQTLNAHGCSAGAEDVRRLIQLTKSHDRLACMACGDGSVSQAANAKLAERETPRKRRTIEALAERIGAAGVVFSGDPRGCTVKLQLADGYTDDMGKEGVCVPTQERYDRASTFRGAP